MSSMYYFAAWTDSGFLLGCAHEHKKIVEADSCIPCAGGYVVAVENGVMRSLTAEEESEFQRAHYAHRPEVETTPVEPAEAAASESGYAVMTRLGLVIVGLGQPGCVLRHMQKQPHTHEKATRLCVFDPPNGRHYGSTRKPLQKSL